MKNESVLLEKLEIACGEEPFKSYDTYEGRREYNVFGKDSSFYLLTFPNGVRFILKETEYHREVYDPEGGGPMEYYDSEYKFSYKQLDPAMQESEYQSIIESEWEFERPYNPRSVFNDEERARMYGEELWYREVLRQDRRQLAHEVYRYYIRWDLVGLIRLDLSNVFGIDLKDEEIQEIIWELDEEIIAMYLEGLSVPAILEALNKRYGLEFCERIIYSALMNHIEHIQPMHHTYPVLYLEAFSCAVRRNYDTIAYVVMGISPEGNRHTLGIQLSDTKKLLSGLTSFLEVLKERGLQNVGIICSAIPDMYQEDVCAVFPNAVYQKSIRYLIEESGCGISKEDKADYDADLERLYYAENETEARTVLEEIKTRWTPKYADQVSWWTDLWEYVKPVFQLSLSVRKAIHFDDAMKERLAFYDKMGSHWDPPHDKEALIRKLLTPDLEPTEQWKSPILNWEHIYGEIKQAYRDILS